jgi:hypothetical protein
MGLFDCLLNMPAAQCPTDHTGIAAGVIPRRLIAIREAAMSSLLDYVVSSDYPVHFSAFYNQYGLTSL